MRSEDGRGVRADDELVDEIENANGGAGPDPIASFDDEDVHALVAEWLADPDHAAEMAESRAEIRNGDTLSLAEVLAELARRNTTR